jgi:hypothetical protein
MLRGTSEKLRRCWFGVRRPQEEFIRDRLLRILRGDVHGVVRGLRRMATAQKLSKEKCADVDAACGYFTAHANRMKYGEYWQPAFRLQRA